MGPLHSSILFNLVHLLFNALSLVVIVTGGQGQSFGGNFQCGFFFSAKYNCLMKLAFSGKTLASF